MTRGNGSGDDDREVSLLAVDQYLRQVRSMPRLSREEEAVLCERVQRGKEERTRTCPDARVLAEAQAARGRLVEGLQWLVMAIARRMVHRFDHLDVMDVIQEGNVGLLHAIEHNDPQAGYPLRALASASIRTAIGEAWHSSERLVGVPVRDRQVWKAVDEVKHRLAEQLQRVPTVKEIAQAAQVDERSVWEFVTVERWRQATSLQALSEQYEMGEDHFGWVSVCEGALSSVSRWSGQVREALVSALTPAQREVVELRFGLREDEVEGWTRAEIAARVGVSSQCIDAREHAAFGRLRVALAGTCALSQGGQGESDLIICEECGAAYPRRRQASRYCGAACRVRVYKRRKRAERGWEVA